ncbi:MAG: hypothetical protein JST93_12670 [Acidobacteria bacterium]|nr:hypothetical protein [Acidobacteriota bacterium]
MWKSILFTLTFSLPSSAVLTLTAPGQDAGFYQGPGGIFAGPVSAAQLGEEFGVAGHRIYGSASAAGTAELGAFLYVMAVGGVTGTLDVDTVLKVNYHFTLTADAQSVPWHVEGLVGTNHGGYYGEANGSATPGEDIAGSFLLYLDSAQTGVIPGGSTLEAWILYLSVGSAGAAGPPLGIALTIPANTLEIQAVGEISEVPEGSTRGLVFRSLLLALALSRFVRAKSC